MSDVDFLNNQWRDTLNEFKEDYEKWERHTLKDYLTRCAEIINNQIKYIVPRFFLILHNMGLDIVSIAKTTKGKVINNAKNIEDNTGEKINDK